MAKLQFAEIAQLDTAALMAQIHLSHALRVATKMEDQMLVPNVQSVISVPHLEQLLFYVLLDLTRIKPEKVSVIVVHMAAIALALISQHRSSALQVIMLPLAI